MPSLQLFGVSIKSGEAHLFFCFTLWSLVPYAIVVALSFRIKELFKLISAGALMLAIERIAVHESS